MDIWSKDWIIKCFICNKSYDLYKVTSCPHCKVLMEKPKFSKDTLVKIIPLDSTIGKIVEIPPKDKWKYKVMVLGKPMFFFQTELVEYTGS